MAIIKPTIGQNNWGDDLNTALDTIDTRLLSLENVVEEMVLLPSWLDYQEGRTLLPLLNEDFGWDSDGAWFSLVDYGIDDYASYPIFTDFTIPENAKVQVEFDVEMDSLYSDAGISLYVDGTTPEWWYGTNPTRIAAQFNGPNVEIQGIENSAYADDYVAVTGTYRMVVVYDPVDTANNVIFRVLTTGNDPQLVAETSLTETLPAGAYRIGFAADMNGDGDDIRTYISNLSISINNGATLYEDTLKNGNSGVAQNLVVPVSVKDAAGNALITFEKSYTGTARIVAPQDDLALRSARDILLYAGNDGPGNVYIGWGDAVYTPESPSRVATIGDLPAGATGTFISQDNKTVTVTNGIITAIDEII